MCVHTCMHTQHTHMCTHTQIKKHTHAYTQITKKHTHTHIIQKDAFTFSYTWRHTHTLQTYLPGILRPFSLCWSTCKIRADKIATENNVIFTLTIIHTNGVSNCLLFVVDRNAFTELLGTCGLHEEIHQCVTWSRWVYAHSLILSSWTHLL